MNRPVLTAATAALLLAMGAAAQTKPKAPKDDPDAIGDRNVCGGINFYSIPAEIALGKQMAQAVARDAKLITDPALTEYVNRLVQNLANNSDAKLPVNVQLVDSDVINAVTLPGGYMIVNAGLLLAADSEAQFAGALAHEVAHVACRHGTRQATNGDLTRIGATMASIAIGGWPGYAIGQGAGAAIPLQYVKFSQRYESDADFYGLQYMYKAGYDPAEMVSFFEKIESMERNKPGTIGKFFSTHPMTDDRLKKSQQEIDKDLADRAEYVVNTSEFDEMKARLSQIRGQKKVEAPDPGRPTLRRRDNQ